MKLDLTKKEDFEGFLEKLTKYQLANLTNDELQQIYSVFAYHSDVMLNEMTKRGMIRMYRGAPMIPTDLPEGMEWPLTVLTGGPLPTEQFSH